MSLDIPKPCGSHVRSSNLTPYCHCSLLNIMGFAIKEVNPHPSIVLHVNM